MTIAYKRGEKLFKRNFKFKQIADFWLSENGKFIEVFDLNNLDTENEFMVIGGIWVMTVKYCDKCKNKIENMNDRFEMHISRLNGNYLQGQDSIDLCEKCMNKIINSIYDNKSNRKERIMK